MICPNLSSLALSLSAISSLSGLYVLSYTLLLMFLPSSRLIDASARLFRINPGWERVRVHRQTLLGSLRSPLLAWNDVDYVYLFLHAVFPPRIGQPAVCLERWSFPRE